MKKFITFIKSVPWVAIAGIFFASLAVGFFIIVPSLREINNTNTKIRSEREDLERLYQQGQYLRTAVKEFEEVRPDVPLVQSAWFTLGEELELITKLEEIAGRVNVIQTIYLDTGAPVATQKIGEHAWRRVLLRLEVGGTFSQILKLLTEIEKLPQFVNVTTLNMTSDTKGLLALRAPAPTLSELEQGQILRVNLTAATYWRGANQKSKIKNQN